MSTEIGHLSQYYEKDQVEGHSDSGIQCFITIPQKSLRIQSSPILDPCLNLTGSNKFGVVIVRWLDSEWVSDWVSELVG